MNAEPPAAIEVSHAEFRAGLPAGHWRLIVNPERARRFVRQRLLLNLLLLPPLGVGSALALSGFTWTGLGLVALAVAGHRLISAQAPRILLHLALRDARVYRLAIEHEILEVRQAR